MLGDRHGIAACWGGLGLVLAGKGDYEAALACYRESLKGFRLIGNGVEVGRTLCHQGEALLKLGQRVRAAQCFQEALAVAQQGADRATVLAAVRRLVWLSKQSAGQEE
ncbi:MAG: tetratricopeptide repeat protein [Synechococcales bacterium]|nr:tetratricopeptide repeat protein [Synechococcales bacterium]